MLARPRSAVAVAKTTGVDIDVVLLVHRYFFFSSPFLVGTEEEKEACGNKNKQDTSRDSHIVAATVYDITFNFPLDAHETNL